MRCYLFLVASPIQIRQELSIIHMAQRHTKYDNTDIAHEYDKNLRGKKSPSAFTSEITFFHIGNLSVKHICLFLSLCLLSLSLFYVAFYFSLLTSRLRRSTPFFIQHLSASVVVTSSITVFFSCLPSLAVSPSLGNVLIFCPPHSTMFI